MNYKRLVFSIIAVWLAIVNCNLPGGQTTQEPSPSPAADLAGTITAMAALPLATASGTPTATIANSPTPCVPLIVANSLINVRSGPGTVYDAIGSLPQGASAGVAGKSDDGTWWYIDFPSGAGGHGWASGSVVTASCIPSTLASIAAPPLPEPKPPTIVPASNPTKVPTAVGPSPVGPSPVGPSPVP
jgi:hypothetical protein